MQSLYVTRPILSEAGFNHRVVLPYRLTVDEIKAAMNDLYDFFYDVNSFLTGRGYGRLEETLAGATFSGLMGELVIQSLSRHSATMTKNTWHNGRPDLVPLGMYSNNGVLRGNEGIEVKVSRYNSGWQGHNVENGWIMVFQYRIDLTTMPVEARQPTRFERVLCAQLEEGDWSFSGRGVTSRRTITASILRTGMVKLEQNPVYVDPLRGTRPRRQR